MRGPILENRDRRRAGYPTVYTVYTVQYAGLRDARADADGREATSRCCVLGWTTDPKPTRLGHVTLLGADISLRCWKYIPIKQAFSSLGIYISRITVR